MRRFELLIAIRRIGFLLIYLVIDSRPTHYYGPNNSALGWPLCHICTKINYYCPLLYFNTHPIRLHLGDYRLYAVCHDVCLIIIWHKNQVLRFTIFMFYQINGKFITKVCIFIIFEYHTLIRFLICLFNIFNELCTYWTKQSRCISNYLVPFITDFYIC